MLLVFHERNNKKTIHRTGQRMYKAHHVGNALSFHTFNSAFFCSLVMLECPIITVTIL